MKKRKKSPLKPRSKHLLLLLMRKLRKFQRRKKAKLKVKLQVRMMMAKDQLLKEKRIHLLIANMPSLTVNSHWSQDKDYAPRQELMLISCSKLDAPGDLLKS